MPARSHCPLPTVRMTFPLMSFPAPLPPVLHGSAAGNTGAHGVGVGARDAGAVVAGRRGVLGGDRKGGLDPLWEGEHDAVRRRPWGLDAVARSATAVGVGATGTEPVLARVGLAQLWPLLRQHLVGSRDSLAVVDERRA